MNMWSLVIKSANLFNNKPLCEASIVLHGAPNLNASCAAFTAISTSFCKNQTHPFFFFKNIFFSPTLNRSKCQFRFYVFRSPKREMAFANWVFFWKYMYFHNSKQKILGPKFSDHCNIHWSASRNQWPKVHILPYRTLYAKILLRRGSFVQLNAILRNQSHISH